MAKPKPKRGNRDPLRLSEPFVFEQGDLETLAKIGIADPALLKQIQHEIEMFTFVRELGLEKATSQEIRAAMNALNEATEALIDALDLDPITSALVEAGLWKTRRATWDELDLQARLQLLLKSVKTAESEFRPRMGRPEKPGRMMLALGVANLLSNHGIPPTKYPAGPFTRTLEVCLQATGDLDGWADTPDISDVVERAVNRLKGPQPKPSVLDELSKTLKKLHGLLNEIELDAAWREHLARRDQLTLKAEDD